MINSLLSKITRFYQLSFVIIMVAALGCVLYFWKMGFLDGSRSKDLHRVSYLLENFEKKKPYNEVNDLINRQNPKLAIQKLKQLEKDLALINKHVSVESFDWVESESQKLQIAAVNLISFSKTSKIISVFQEKLNSFSDYVTKNNWRTLTRSSERVLTLVSGHVNSKALNTLTRGIEREFDSMVRVTEGSSLERTQKSEIISRIEALRVEVEMLKKYSVEKNFFDSLSKSFGAQLGIWMEQVSPEITLQKLTSEQIGRYYLISFVGIMGLVTSLFFGSFIFSKIYFKKAAQKLEKSLEKYITEGILEKDTSIFADYSENFQLFSKRISNYIDKRMSFGSIFQEALPLSSILLDKNLKIIWANKHFCDAWNLNEEEMKKDYMSWDYLSKLTNIGNDDPVLEALKNNIAGIYQVQVKNQEAKEAKPYEMFVSPVKLDGQTRIMLFFYDLTNLEATIKDQAVSILNPVRDTVNLFARSQFTESTELKNEFSIAGIEDVYQNFLNLHRGLIEKEDLRLDEIEALYQRVDVLTKRNEIALSQSESNSGRYHEVMGFLKNFKNNVISLSTLSRDLDTLSGQEMEIIYSNLEVLSQSRSKVEKLKEVTQNLVSTMPKLDKLRDDIRGSKSALYESKMKLSHELAQLGVLFKRSDDPGAMDKIARTLLKVMSSFKDLDQFSTDLDKKVSNLEVSMSKTQMVIAESQVILERITSIEEQNQLSIGAEKVKRFTTLKKGSSERIEDLEEEIVKSLEGLFHTTKITHNSISDISDSLAH